MIFFLIIKVDLKSITNRGFVNKEAGYFYKSTGGIMVLKRGFYFKKINTYSKIRTHRD